MPERIRNVLAVAAPAVCCLIGVLLWWRWGYEPLNEWELPLAAAINGLCGRSETFDHLVVWLNHWWGEALFVVLAVASYLLFVRWVIGPRPDWRPALVYAGYILAFWVLANAIGDHIIEEYMPRDSPSYFLGERFVDLEEVRGVEVKTESRSSFPSNHGSVFFTLFFMCLHRFGAKGWALFPVCFLLSMPRIFTGAHWVTDTLIGSVLVTWLVAAVAIHTPILRLALWAEAVALRTPASAPVGNWLEPPMGPQRD